MVFKAFKKLLKTNNQTSQSAPMTNTLSNEQAIAGYYKGKHFTEYAEEIKSLKKEEKYEEVIELLNGLVEATERESKADGGGVAPGYYQQLAVVYRKLKQEENEVSILERFAKQTHAPGAMPGQLLERLEKLKKDG